MSSKRSGFHAGVSLRATSSVVCVLLILTGSSTAATAETLDLGTVNIGGGIDDGTAGEAAAAPAAPPKAATASRLASPVPTETPLSATQPTSVIGEQFIRNSVPPSGTYDTIVGIAPSTLAISPNGPGLGDASDVTIRGFADGQYNVTFDGIPFADSDDFSHHSSAYFSAHSLGAVSIDRGPGTASTIGDATFGGTISLLSRDPAKAPGGEAFTSFGSSATHLFGAVADSGPVPTLQGGSYLLDVERLDSGGYLTETEQSRTNLFIKGVQPVGDNTLLTAVATTLWQNGAQSVGATRAQIAAFGPNFALSRDPNSQNDVDYNKQTYKTDFEYFGVQSQLTPAITLDNKLYTYALYRHFNAGEDVNGETPNGTVYGAQDVPGQMANNDLRAYGDVLRLSGTLPFGVLRSGLWIEHQNNTRSQYEVDETLGGALNPILTPVPDVANSAAIDRLQRDSLDTMQPYLELEWRVTPALTVTPGLKYAIFHRGEDAPVNEGTRLSLKTDVAYSSPVPALAVHYQIDPGWAAYLQVAKGILAPQLQSLDVPDPRSNPVSPETTINYQIGTSWKHGRFALSADGYYIDFNNMVGTRTVGGEAQLVQEGGVNYFGLEGDVTVGLGQGFSLYANGSVNSARQKDGGAPVPDAPVATMAGGVLYGQERWFGSLIDKRLGSRYGDVDRQQGLQPFNQLDATIGWALPAKPGVRPALKLQFTVQNLLNSRKIDDLAGYTAAQTTPLYFTQAGRSGFFSASALF